MRLRFDQLGKQVGCATLECAGKATADAEIAPDAQRADLRFEPDPARAAERMKLGLLGRLAATPCLIEIYSGAPSAEQLRACLRKHLAFWWARVRDARRAKPSTPPMLWVLCAGRPVSALKQLAFFRARGFPTGVHRVQNGLRMGLVVASDLPRTRSTLLVRLMAGGRGLEAAMRDLAALPRDAPERALATRPVLRLARALTGKRRPSREERSFIMATQDVFAELEEKARRQGQREGQREGRRTGRLEEARAALRAVLAKRRLVTSADDEAKIDACTRPAILRRWLDQAIDAASLAEALR